MGVELLPQEQSHFGTELDAPYEAPCPLPVQTKKRNRLNGEGTEVELAILPSLPNKTVAKVCT
jgi:hypothetical protein